MDSLNNNPSFLQVLSATILLSISLKLTTLGISCNWNQTVFVLCFLILPWSLWSFHIVTCIRSPYPFFKKWEYNGLTCWVRFWCTAAWMSGKYVYVYMYIPSSWASLPPSHPRSADDQRVPSLAPCASQQPPTSFCFTHGSVYMSELLSRFTPPSPLPPASTPLFSTSEFLFLLCK